MPLFSGWANTSTTGGQTPVYGIGLGSLFGGTIATTATTPVWYSNGLANQTPTTSAQTNSTVWYTNRNVTDWTSQANAAPNGSWVLWEDDVEHSQYIALAQGRVAQTRRRTEEQEQRWQQERAAALAEQLRLAQERAVALARSKELLLVHLTAKQRETFERKLWFVVEGGKSKQLYRIRNSGSYSANIDVLEGKPGKVTHRLCCHLADYRVPLYDHLLAQKVWIEHDEDDFLRQANRHAA